MSGIPKAAYVEDAVIASAAVSGCGSVYASRYLLLIRQCNSFPNTVRCGAPKTPGR